jgi:putative intracellular protease/amidase
MFAKTEDKLTLSQKQLDIKLQLNPGVPEELYLVFPVSLVVELTVPVKLLLETCAEVDVCLPPLKPGEDGTVE